MINISNTSKVDMQYLYSALGLILQHLLSLEYVMREVLKKENIANSLIYFGNVLDKYNSHVGTIDRIDIKLKDLRNALAHGLITFPMPNEESLGTLIKFKKYTKELEFQEELNREWLREQVEKTRLELLKASKALGTEIIQVRK